MKNVFCREANQPKIPIFSGRKDGDSAKLDRLKGEMKTLTNPAYTFLLSILSWGIFLFFIIPGPFEFNKMGAYVVFTMGVFPGLLVISLLQMIKHKFKNTFGWLSILSSLLAGWMLLTFIYASRF